MYNRLLFLLAVLAAAVAMPRDVRGQGAVQASIAGVVRDASGAVVPGVTVEASSPVLIEKSRSATSDDTGRYRIVGLTPGTYTLTFTLQGFNTVKREGIVLAGSLTATIDVEMRVGSLEETVTVKGESPIVDVQSAKQQRVIGSDTFNSIPGSRNYHNLVVLVPGLNAGGQNVGGINGPGSAERGRPRWRACGRPLQRRWPGRQRVERRRDALRDRHGECGGSDDRRHRRAGRGRGRWAGDQRGAQDGRQHVQRLGVRRWRQRLDAGQQLRRRADRGGIA